MSLTSLEKTYVINLARKLKRTPQINKSFTSNKLKRYFELRLSTDTLGGMDKISVKEFHEIMDIVGFKSQRVIAGSPYYYYNIDEMDIIQIFGSII